MIASSFIEYYLAFILTMETGINGCKKLFSVKGQKTAKKKWGLKFNVQKPKERVSLKSAPSTVSGADQTVPSTMSAKSQKRQPHQGKSRQKFPAPTRAT